MIPTWIIKPEVQRCSDAFFTVIWLGWPIRYLVMQLLNSRAEAVFLQMLDTANDAEIVSWIDKRAEQTELRIERGL